MPSKKQIDMLKCPRFWFWLRQRGFRWSVSKPSFAHEFPVEATGTLSENSRSAPVHKLSQSRRSDRLEQGLSREARLREAQR